MAETKRSAAKSWLVTLGYVIAAGVALATGRALLFGAVDSALEHGSRG